MDLDPREYLARMLPLITTYGLRLIGVLIATWQATVRAIAYELPKAKIAMPTPAMNVTVSGKLG